jgi:hypothetical protein
MKSNTKLLGNVYSDMLNQVLNFVAYPSFDKSKVIGKLSSARDEIGYCTIDSNKRFVWMKSIAWNNWEIFMKIKVQYVNKVFLNIITF